MAESGWEFSCQTRIHAGPGMSLRLSEWIPKEKTLLVTSAGFSRRGTLARIRETLKTDDVVVFDKVTPNPDVDFLDDASEFLAGDAATRIVALGGGSVLDTAKVLSLTLPASVRRPLHQVFRSGSPVAWKGSLPVIAIPTTAGTGAEVTPFATVWDRASFRKNSLAHELMQPHSAVLDPELTLTLSRDETLFGGLDTLSHALESLWNRNRSPISETLSLRAIGLATDALEGVLNNPDDLRQRQMMQLASLLAGMAISQTRTAVAHAISYPLTLRYGVPHGLACGFTLGSLIDAVVDEPTCVGFAAQMRTVKALLARLNVHSEISKRISPEQALAVIDEMVTPGRSENFIVPLTRENLQSVLSTSFGPAV